MSYVEDAAVREDYEREHVADHWPHREVIRGAGGVGCDIMVRWEPVKLRGWKLLVHHFLPYAEDTDTDHDHPAPFLTLVLRGRYWDATPCGCLEENSYGSLAEVYRQNDLTCPDCGGTGRLWEEMKAGTLRWRAAEHMHRTVTTGEGAWTIVLMKPKARDWGLVHVRDRVWLPWGEFVKRYGAAMKCPDDETGVGR